MPSPESPDPLSPTLARWRVDPPRTPEFRAAVLSRLKAGVGAVPWSVYARQHATFVGGAIAVAVALGALGGVGRARTQAAADNARLAATYVQGLDARAMATR